jgi:hypothetical protein
MMERIMSSKIYIVKPRKQERRQLEALIRKGKSVATRLFESPDSAEGGSRAARRGLARRADHLSL